jgi:hypothetical protein
MIHFSFNITNPWSKRKLTSITSKHGSTPWKHKFWEFDLTKSRSILGINLTISHRQSHSRFEILLGLIGYDLIFSFYDDRHWDYDNERWEKIDDKENLL